MKLKIIAFLFRTMLSPLFIAIYALIIWFLGIRFTQSTSMTIAVAIGVIGSIIGATIHKAIHRRISEKEKEKEDEPIGTPSDPEVEIDYD